MRVSSSPYKQFISVFIKLVYCMNIDSLKTNLSKLMQCTHCTAVYGAVVNQEERFELVPLLDIKYLDINVSFSQIF